MCWRALRNLPDTRVKGKLDGIGAVLIGGALAAFNIGLGHLEDARVLAQRQKLNPDLWSDLKKTLPLLALPEYYAYAKNGYARGGMPVVFVDRVRAYYDILLAREAGYVPRLRVSVPSIGGGGPAPLPAMP